jgi:hypothetical protein
MVCFASVERQIVQASLLDSTIRCLPGGSGCNIVQDKHRGYFDVLMLVHNKWIYKAAILKAIFPTIVM